MTHSFHIPVLGLAFSADTAIKVAQYGISSVISIVDDELLERLRAYYAPIHGIPYHEISNKLEDSRARRITAYLNLVQEIVNQQIEHLKNSDWERSEQMKQYLDLLPEQHKLKKYYDKYVASTDSEERFVLKNKIKSLLIAGSIDVNIMSKVDKVNFTSDGIPLSDYYTDASAAVRGYANSTLKSSLILSAGMNPRLYAYLADTKAFFPNEKGQFDKKITLKVSDFRSASIQAKYLAKRGIWISEYRVESGLNCGGHAFATEGFLLGPILEEFKQNKQTLIEELYPLYQESLTAMGYSLMTIPEVKLSVQGGVGTAAEHQFLLDYYQMDAVGWGSPFLLVPEATTVDDDTLNKLATAVPEDFYLSDASPLGVPFNNFRHSSAEKSRLNRIAQGRPGFPCTKKYLVMDTPYSKEPLCTASRQYQVLKIRELDEKELSQEAYAKAFDQIVAKQCLCEGLATPAYLKYNLLKARERSAVAICPGPNTAYFNKVYSLKEMVDHIYGRINVLADVKRPSMFINELELYVKHLAHYFQEHVSELDIKKKKYINKFQAQLLEGISYYRSLQEQGNAYFGESKAIFFDQLLKFEHQLKPLVV